MYGPNQSISSWLFGGGCWWKSSARLLLSYFGFDVHTACSKYVLVYGFLSVSEAGQACLVGKHDLASISHRQSGIGREDGLS